MDTYWIKDGFLEQPDKVGFFHLNGIFLPNQLYIGIHPKNKETSITGFYDDPKFLKIIQEGITGKHANTGNSYDLSESSKKINLSKKQIDILIKQGPLFKNSKLLLESVLEEVKIKI